MTALDSDDDIPGADIPGTSLPVFIIEENRGAVVAALGDVKWVTRGDGSGDSWHGGDDSDGFKLVQEKIWGVSRVFTGLLYEPPCTDLHDEGVDGLFGDSVATKIVDLLREIEQRAAA